MQHRRTSPERQASRLDAFQEVEGKGELQPLVSGEVDVTRACADGNGAILIKPGHVAQGPNERQSGIECVLVVAQLHQYPGHCLVGDLKPQFPE